MSSDKFSESLNGLLSEGRIGHVVRVLRDKCAASAASHPDLSRLQGELDRVADTYSHMRQFLISGGSDPGRPEVYASIKEQLRSIALSYLFIVNEDRLDPFFADYRLQKVRRRTVEELAEELKKIDFHIEMAAETESDPLPFRKKREDTIDALFHKVWSLPPWASADREALVPLLTSDDYTVVSQIISALLLGLLKFNDPAKFLLLLKAYDEAADERIAARALMAAVLVLGRWGHSVMVWPKVAGALAALEDSILTYSRVRDIVMTLIKTRDTDRVSREVSEAFNSTMKEIPPEMLEKLQRQGLTADASETGFNPEWEKLMNNKEIEERMKAVNDMQLEGLDVMMQSFSRLKSFPFFRPVSSWFLPFSPTHSSVAELFSVFSPQGFNIMADATEMCASDRYSFALGILQMPRERRDMLAMSFGSQLEALRDMIKDRENVRRKPVFATEALVFARDLYRFAKLFPSRKDFYDPFGEPIDFLRLPLLGTLLEGDDILLQCADFYFRHGYYGQALGMYRRSAAEPSRDLYEKIGYCCQMEGDIAGALQNYEQADLFSTDIDRSSSWLLKKIAFTNKALGNFGRAAEYYSRLLERDPDDLRVTFHLGSVLLRAGEMDRGRELVAKVHYMDPSHKMAARVFTRLRGHEAFLEGRYSDALSLYEEARGGQPEAEYRADLADELQKLNGKADIEALQILLDS